EALYSSGFEIREKLSLSRKVPEFPGLCLSLLCGIISMIELAGLRQPVGPPAAVFRRPASDRNRRFAEFFDHHDRKLMFAESDHRRRCRISQTYHQEQILLCN